MKSFAVIALFLVFSLFLSGCVSSQKSQGEGQSVQVPVAGIQEVSPDVPPDDFSDIASDLQELDVNESELGIS